MTKAIELVAPEVVTNRIPFVVSVDLHGPTLGMRITVTLEQKHITPALRTMDCAVIATSDGEIAMVSFKVVLEEPGTALLMATAHDELGAQFRPDGAIVEVL